MLFGRETVRIAVKRANEKERHTSTTERDVSWRKIRRRFGKM